MYWADEETIVNFQDDGGRHERTVVRLTQGGEFRSADVGSGSGARLWADDRTDAMSAEWAGGNRQAQVDAAKAAWRDA